MAPELRIDVSVFWILGLALLILPIPWLLAALIGVVIHELFHFTMAKMLHVACREIHIGISGVYMLMPCMTAKEEICIATAGPLGSMLLLLFLKVYPQLALCGLVQGLFNLMPVYPFDGGRILQCLLGNRRVLRWIEYGFLAGCWGMCIWLWYVSNLDVLPLVLGFVLTYKAIYRKFPCKERRIGVQ